MADSQGCRGGTDRSPPAASEHNGKKKLRDAKETEASMHHDGDFGRYMQLKVAKLREQFDAQQLQQHIVSKSDIFSGISIHVNGFTRPSHAELKQLMALHGGRFENYLYRDSVTHIICSNLPDTKIKQLAHERKPIPIVRPEWVLASIAAGRLLPVSDFQLQSLSGAVSNQRRLFDFKRHEAPKLPPEELYPVLEKQKQVAEEQQQECEQGQQQQALDVEDYGRPAKRLRGCRTSQEHHKHPAGDLQQPLQQIGRVDQQQQQMEGAGYVRSQDWEWGGEERDEEDKAPQDRPQQRLLGPHPTERNHHGVHNPQPLLTHGSSAERSRPGAASPLQPAGPLGSSPGLPPPLPQPLDPASAYSWPPRAPSPGTPPLTGRGQLPSAVARPQTAAGGQVVTSRESETGPGKSGPVAGPPLSPGPVSGLVSVSVPRSAQALAAELRAASDAIRGPPRSTHTDPHFMTTYFKQSRLHHIGTWRNRIEALMAEVEASAPNPAPYAKGTERVILHVDMDCFFASVGAVGRPELAGRPVAVCHSNSSKGTGEVSSANYLARSFGVRADMFISEAKRLCPELVVLPYEFDKYQEVSEQVYRILLSYTSVVQPMSCDEAFLDVTGLDTDPDQLAARMRAQITTTTRCTATAGIAPNMLLAKLATKRGKPNGQFRVTRGSVLDFLGDHKVEELPGVGYSLTSKLQALGITHVRQVWSSSRTVLQKQLGAKVGADLWAHAHGQDERRVEPPKARKSVGAEVNYGIRFDASAVGQAEAERFVSDLAGEVAGRLLAAGVKGRSLVLKVKRRKAGAPEPFKFMGHGACDNISRSVTLSRFTDQPADLRREGLGLLRALAIPPEELRGLGLIMCRLDNDPASHTTCPSAPASARLQVSPRTAFDASKQSPWLVYFQRKAQQQQQDQEQQPQSGAAQDQDGQAAGEDAVDQANTHHRGRPPTLCHPHLTAVGPHPSPLPDPAATITDTTTKTTSNTLAPAPVAVPVAGGTVHRPRLAGGPVVAGKGQSRSTAGGGTAVDSPTLYPFVPVFNEGSPASVGVQQHRKQQQLIRQQSYPIQSLPHKSNVARGARSPLHIPEAATAAPPADRAEGLVLIEPTPIARNRAPPRLHPVFASLLSQRPAAAAAAAATSTISASVADGSGAVGTGCGRGGGDAQAPVHLNATRQQQAMSGRAPAAAGNELPVDPENGSNTAVAATVAMGATAATVAAAGASASHGAVSASEGPAARRSLIGIDGDVAAPPAAKARQQYQEQGGHNQQASGLPNTTAAATSHTTGPDAVLALPPTVAGGRSAASRLLPPKPRQAMSGTQGVVRGMVATAAAAPGHRAGPPASTMSMVSAGGGPSAVSSDVTRVVESIDLSVEAFSDEDDNDFSGSVDGGGGRRDVIDDGIGNVEEGDGGGDDSYGGHSEGHPRVVELAEEGAETRLTAGAPDATTTAHASRMACPARSETTSAGGPVASTSAVVSGSALARWPEGFLRHSRTVGMEVRAGAGAAGRGRGGRGRSSAGVRGGRGSGRGRTGGSSGGAGARGVSSGPSAPAVEATSVMAVDIDRSVLAELPPDVRREIEREYGLLASVPSRRTAPTLGPGPSRPAKRARGGGHSHGDRSSAAAALPQYPALQNPRLGADRRKRDSCEAGAVPSTPGAAPTNEVRLLHTTDRPWEEPAGKGPEGVDAGGLTGGSCARRSVAAEAAIMPLTMDDVDLAVLDELPAELRSEIMSALRDCSTGPLTAVMMATAGAQDVLRSSRLSHTLAGGRRCVRLPGPANGNFFAAPGHMTVGKAPAPTAVLALRRFNGADGPPAQGAMEGEVTGTAGGAGRGGLEPRQPHPTAGPMEWLDWGNPDVQEMMAVEALPAGSGLQQRLAAATAHMFPKSGAGVNGGDVRRAFLAAIRSACVSLRGLRDSKACAALRGSDESACRIRQSKVRRQSASGSLVGDTVHCLEDRANAEGGLQEEAGSGEEPRLQLIFMALALWLIGQDQDLEEIVSVLRQVHRLVGSRPREGEDTLVHVRMYVLRVVRAVEEHVLSKYGFKLRM